MPNLSGRSLLLAACLWSAFGDRTSAAEVAPSGTWEWVTVSPREEITPVFDRHVDGSSNLVLTISADDRKGLIGHWQTSVPVRGGRHYRFRVERFTDGIDHPRRSAVARLIWRDADGNPVKHAEPASDSFRRGERPRAEPEFPQPVGRPTPSATPAAGDASTGDPPAWQALQGTYLAPPTAARVIIELGFRWGDPGSSVHWRNVSFEKVQAPDPHLIRLAAVHYQPKEGRTPAEKRRQFEPFIRQAAARRADLVVLPETLTYYASGGTYADAAEPVPGPSTEFFGELADELDLYIVAGLLEREENLIYNVAVLLGPDGELAGKYRKVCLPRGEIEGGIMPGEDYPVFQTRFGKIGMMVCYDGFFPEVARELANRGADVIAWPVWGCNPLLAKARACENHVYVVSSTYTKYDDNWMRTAIYSQTGATLSEAEAFGSLAFAEVDLNRPVHWHSLGDFKAQLPAHRPVSGGESPAE